MVMDWKIRRKCDRITIQKEIHLKPEYKMGWRTRIELASPHH